MPPARIVFDLDGTLIDSAPDLQALANRVLAARGVPPVSLAETHEFIGNGVAVFIRRMRLARDLPEAEEAALMADFSAGYTDAKDLTKPYPGVAGALRALRAAGHALAICTNKPAGPAEAILRHLGLLTQFQVIVGGDTLPQRKPDPAPLRAALEALPPGPALFVGDSEVDCATAEAAGVPFLLFTEGYRHSPPEALPHRAAFADWAGLPDLVARLL